MKYKNKLLAATLATFACTAAFAEGHAHWGYQGKHGAGHWADMEPGFSACRMGREQSPVDIHTRQAKSAQLDPIAFNYAAGAAEVTNNGHTVQVNLPAGGAIKLGDAEYKLLQFHFHTPSEEAVNGKRFPLVAHFVHKNADGQLAVVAALFKVGKENAALQPVFSQLPGKEGETAKLDGFNPADLLPADQTYYAFMGSLTTPPCSEGVRWQVLKTPVELSKGQLAAFRKLYKMNARPVQPLHGREIKVSG